MKKRTMIKQVAVFMALTLFVFLLAGCSKGIDAMAKLSDWDDLRGKTVSEVGKALEEDPVLEGPTWEFPERVYLEEQEFILTISFDEEGKMHGVRYRIGFQGDDYVEKAVQLMDTLEEAIVSEFGEVWTYPGIKGYSRQEDPAAYFAKGHGLRDDWVVDAENHVWASLVAVVDDESESALIMLSYGINEDLTIPSDPKWSEEYASN